MNDLVSIDIVAMNCYVEIGGEIYKKVAPLICAKVSNGSLLYDARLYPQWKNAKPALVRYMGKTIGQS